MLTYADLVTVIAQRMRSCKALKKDVQRHPIIMEEIQGRWGVGGGQRVTFPEGWSEVEVTSEPQGRETCVVFVIPRPR